jgi:hypothetical protein
MELRQQLFRRQFLRRRRLFRGRWLLRELVNLYSNLSLLFYPGSIITQLFS